MHKVNKGELWHLGNHRLLCGDSRSLQNIKMLLGRNKIHLVFSGPPYFNQRAYGHWKTYSSYDSYLTSMQKVIKNCDLHLNDGGVLAWQIGRGAKEHKDHVGFISTILDEQHLQFQDAIVWIKPSANYSIKRSCHILTNGFYYPAFRWEVILIYRKNGPMPRMSFVDRKYMAQHHTDVWTIPWVTHQMKQYKHPAVCPIEIPIRCIRAYSKKGNNVFEPFAGSGTTLIAAEQINRKCFAIEANPNYCATIIKRWEELTGQKAFINDSIVCAYPTQLHRPRFSVTPTACQTSASSRHSATVKSGRR
jgi:DNA modification methylase